MENSNYMRLTESGFTQVLCMYLSVNNYALNNHLLEKCNWQLANIVAIPNSRYLSHEVP